MDNNYRLTSSAPAATSLYAPRSAQSYSHPQPSPVASNSYQEQQSPYLSSTGGSNGATNGSASNGSGGDAPGGAGGNHQHSRFNGMPLQMRQMHNQQPSAHSPTVTQPPTPGHPYATEGYAGGPMSGHQHGTTGYTGYPPSSSPAAQQHHGFRAPSALSSTTSNEAASYEGRSPFHNNAMGYGHPPSNYSPYAQLPPGQLPLPGQPMPGPQSVYSNVGNPRQPPHVLAPGGGMFAHQFYPNAYRNGLPASGPGNAPERPYRCTKCPQAFSRNHDLKRHLRIHLDVKPYACEGCQKTFSRKDALKRHKLVKGCTEADKRRSKSPPKKTDDSRGSTDSPVALPSISKKDREIGADGPNSGGGGPGPVKMEYQEGA